MTFFYQNIGSIYIATDGENLRVLAIDRNNWHRLRSDFSQAVKKEHSILLNTKKQLNEYFSHQRTQFDLPISFDGTPFQVAAWNALLAIPYGETKNYSEQALMINNPNAVRAIGRSNGLNPISIIVPCHRVIGKSGKLTGYASGLGDKKYLLDLERKVFTLSQHKNFCA